MNFYSLLCSSICFYLPDKKAGDHSAQKGERQNSSEVLEKVTPLHTVASMEYNRRQ